MQIRQEMIALARQIEENKKVSEEIEKQAKDVIEQRGG